MSREHSTRRLLAPPKRLADVAARPFVAAGVVLVVLQVVFAVPAFAASGDLDPTFGIGGKVTRDFFGNRDEARAVAITANGKIVVAGFARSGTDQGPDSILEDFALERYEADGTLDPTFGTGGDTFTDFGGSQDRASDVLIQPNGKIVAAGGTCTGVNFDVCDFALARFQPNGSPDPSFGSGGKVITHFAGLSTLAFSIAVQPSGKIVAAGFAFGGSGFDFALARYHADGTLDAGFGSGGMVTTDLASGDDFGNAVVVLPTGKIVAAGAAFSGTTFDLALVGYTASGALDRSFGVGGKVFTDLGSTDDEIQDLALQADGRIVALGETFDATGVAFALARYEGDGALDAGFGSGGYVTTDFGSSDAQGESVAVQPDGKIVAAGGGLFGPNIDFQLARYERDGTLDAGFGTVGLVSTDFFGATDRALAIALEADGAIVLAGHSFNGVNRDVALARYVPR